MKVIYCLIFSILLMNCLSCTKINDVQKEKTKSLIFDDTLNINLQFTKPEITANMPKIAHKHDSLQDIRCPLNHDDWQNIISYFRQFTKDETDPWYIIMYLDKICNINDSININDIIAFRTYTIKPNNKIYHRFFYPDNVTFVEKTQFNCETIYFYCSIESYFMNYEINYHNATPYKNAKIIFYSDSLKEHHPDKYNHDFLSRRIEKYGKKKI